MIRPVLICGLIVSWVAVVSADPPNDRAETVTIPLDQIWAYDMPGTRDVRELEPKSFGERTRDLPSAERFRLLDASNIEQIGAALRRARATEYYKAQAGFAVVGIGREALEGAYEVLVKNAKPDVSFPLDSNVTLVFFSRLAGQFVHLKQVEQHDRTISVEYQAVPHTTTNSTWHLALIPVGTLPIGKYEVEIVQSPGGKDNTQNFVGGFRASEAQQIVCRSFAFSIIERK